MRVFVDLFAKVLRVAGNPLSSKTVVTLDSDMRSCNVALNEHCPCTEAIAKIEDHLRGTRPDTLDKHEDRFELDRHSAV